MRPRRSTRLVFGVQPVREVLRAHGDAAGPLVISDSDSQKLEGLARLAASRDVPVERAPRAELDRRTKGGMHQGAVIYAPELALLSEEELFVEIEGDASALVMIADGVMDPQNFGAVVRSSVALGARHVIWPEHGSAPLTPATFRASAGAIEHARLVRVRSLPSLFTGLHERGLSTVLLEGSSEQTLESVDLRGPVAIIVGAEDRGAKPAVRRAVTAKARLPIAVIDSLNASVAAALALYEVGRQRRAAIQ